MRLKNTLLICSIIFILLSTSFAFAALPDLSTESNEYWGVYPAGQPIKYVNHVFNNTNVGGGVFYMYLYAKKGSEDYYQVTSWVDSDGLEPWAYLHCETHKLILSNGSYTTKFVIDPENLIHESNEGNNERLVWFDVTGGQPDLTVIYMNVPDNPQAGVPFNFEAKIENIGWADASSLFYARLYVDDVPKVWWKWDNGLKAQWNSTLTYNGLTLPAGTHTLKLVVDADGNIPESNEGNNEMSVTRTWTGGQPDLTVIYMHLLDDNMNILGNLEAGVPFNFEAKIENIGWADASGLFTARLYVNDVQKAWWKWDNGLKAQWNSTLTKKLTLPAGTYTFKLVVDADGNIPESNEGNNELSATWIWTGGQPDLTVIYMNVPDNPLAGVPYNFEAEIKNIGWADASGLFYARLYVDDVLKHSWYWSNGMKAQWGSALGAGLTLPNGTHTIKLVVDADGNISESNEGNNEMSVTRTWTDGQPDLTVEYMNVPDNLQAGVPFNFEAKIVNIGWADASSLFYTRLYVDGKLTNSWKWSNGLKAQYYSIINKELTLPDGTHTLKLVVDSGNNIAESEEGNNEMSVTRTWTGGSVDFTVSRLDEPSSTMAGVPFEITGRVENIGWASTSATIHARLYIDDIPRVDWKWDGYSALSYSEITTSPVSLQLPSGLHTFRLKMDADNVVEEPEEGNNEMSYTVIFTWGAPTGLNGKAGPGSGQVTLWWDSNPDPDIAYYRIYQGTSPGNYYFYYDHVFKEWNKGVIISGLANGMTYYFTVTAINTMGLESDYSNEVSIVPIMYGDVQPPTVPSNLNIFDPGTGSSLKISWSSSQDNVAVSYYLLYRLTNSSAVSAINYDLGFPIAISQTKYIDSNVEEGNTYYYRVQAVDTSGNRSGLSNTEFDDPTDLLAPSSPYSLNAVSGDGSVSLSWNAPAVNSDGSALNDLVGYNIYRRESSGNYSTFPINGEVLISTTYFLDPDLVNGTKYYYVATAVDDSGNESIYSQEASATPKSTDLPPVSPTNLTLVSRASELALFWDTNKEPDILGYNVYRKIQGESYSGTPLNIAPITNTSYIDKDIEPTLVYFYIVRAIDEAGQESGNSNEVFGKVGTGGLWIISPTTQTQAVLDFDTQTNPGVTIVYHLNPDYLNLFPQGAKVKLEVINANNLVVYTAWDYDPKGSGASFNPHFLWNGKDKDGKIVNQGVYTIKVSIFSNKQVEEVLLWDKAENAIQVINSGIKVNQALPDKPVKVLISTLHDDNYPSNSQTEDRKVRVTAKVEPVKPNANVYFRVFDPDDNSSYETNTIGDDNHDSVIKRGNIGAVLGYTVIQGSQVIDTNGNIIELGIKTDSQGLAKVDLLITNQYAGDNYIVRVDTKPNPDADDSGTGLLVAWKRIYIEEDYMYKVGADLIADFIQDGNNDPDTIQVQDTASLSVGDTIIIFDADYPIGETAQITAKTANTLTLNIDLKKDYHAGYSFPSGRGAAVAKPAGGVYDANIEGRTPNTYGALIDGSDGGCFVEVKILPDGGGNVPYRKTFGSMQARIDYNNVWFKNKNKPNYIHVTGSSYHNLVGDGTLGTALASENYIYIYVSMINDEPDCSSNPSIANAETCAHEIGHQFNLANVDLPYVYIWCHLGPDTDYCVMTYDTDMVDEYSEFCSEAYNGHDHLREVRDAPDNL